MKTPLFFTGSSTSNVSNTADRYAPLAGSGPGAVTYATLSASRIPNAVMWPTAGKISSLRARFPAGSPALSAGSFTVTLMKGTAQNSMTATALTVTINAANLTQVDLVTELSVAEDDFLAWKITPSGVNSDYAPGASIQISCVFESTTAGRSVMLSTIASGSAACAVAPGCGAPNNLTEATATVVFPVPGTIGKIKASLNNNGGAPGSGNSRTLTLRKGTVGSLADTALAVTFGASDVNKSLDLGGSPVSVSAGDAVSIAQTITGTPTASTVVLAIEFIPTTAGQAVRFATFGSLSTTAARYGVLAGFNPNAEANDNNSTQLAPVDLTIKSLRVDTTTAPGSGKTRTNTVRKNASATAMAAQIADAATSASDTRDIAVAGGDTLALVSTPSGTPTASSWLAVATVMVVDATAPPVNFTDTDKAGQTFEGIRNTSAVQIGGTYSGTPTDVQVRLVDGGGTVISGFDWTSAATQTGGVYSHTFSGVPVGGPYYQQARDNGGTATTSTHDLYVGAVVVFWGQSQCVKLFTDDTSGLAPTSGSNVRVMAYASQTDVSSGSPTITKLTNGMGAVAKVTGSGAVAAANQWHADVGASVPLMLVICAYSGTSIEFWVNDRKGDYPTNADVTTLWGTTPTTGFAWHMAAAARYQASAIVFMQGTSDVNSIANVNSSGQSYAQLMDSLKAKFESLYNARPVLPLFLVVPHQRSDDGNNTFAMRAVQYAKAISGGTWRLCCWLLDWQLNSDGDPHQKAGVTGNIRGGTRIGRGLAKHLNNSGLDIGGPQISTAKFTDTNRNVIEITFDRNVELADGTAYAGSPVAIPDQFVVSNDNGSSFPTLAAAGNAATLTAANKVRIAKDSGAWSEGLARVDFLRGVPFASDAATTNDYVGTEANMEANYLSKVIVDTSGFDGGRGMPMAPVMGTGFAVAESGLVAPRPVRRPMLVGVGR